MIIEVDFIWKDFYNLNKKLSMLNLSKAPTDENDKDTAERLAEHFSEYETKRFGEILGVNLK